MRDELLKSATVVCDYWLSITGECGNCRDASYTLQGVLGPQGYFALVRPVKVSVWNPTGWDTEQRGGTESDFREEDRPVGSGYSIAPEGQETFHFVVLAKWRETSDSWSDFWLVDPTVSQYGNAAEARPVDDPLAVRLPKHSGEELVPEEFPVELPAGVRVVYEYVSSSDPLTADLRDIDLDAYQKDVEAVLQKLKGS